MHKVKDGEVHKVKDKVINEVVKMYKDLKFSVRADGWDKNSVFRDYLGDDWCCLGGDEYIGGYGGRLGGPQGGEVGHQGCRQGHDRE